MSPPTLDAYLTAEADQILTACTRCGKCVEVCPVIPYSEAKGDCPESTVTALAQFLERGENLTDGAAGWMNSCNGCGECIPACPEGVNPRKMLMLAATKASTVSSQTPELFRRMSRSLKIMLAMQMLPGDFRKLFGPPRRRDAPIVFYLGCNALRTPSLLFNTMQVLDAIGSDYEVVGGPSSCCGVIATKWEGQTKTGEHVTRNTINRFEGYKPDKVLNWCPTCALHLGETLGGFQPTSFSFDHVTGYIVEHLEKLAPKLVGPVRRRVVLHGHVGCAEISENVARLLRAIPGLDFVETVYESGYTCGGSGCSKSPGLAAKEHAELVARARAVQADTLVTLYHGCHMVFIGAEKSEPFQVLNFTDLLVEALGGAPKEDRLKKLRLLDDWNMIVAEAQPYLRANGIELTDDWLKAHGAEIFAAAEFKGGLDCMGTSPRSRANQ